MSVEGAGLTAMRIEPEYTSRTCSACGKVWKDQGGEFGLVTWSQFRCDCGFASFAPWNAAMAIGQAAIRQIAENAEKKPPADK